MFQNKIRITYDQKFAAKIPNDRIQQTRSSEIPPRLSV